MLASTMGVQRVELMTLPSRSEESLMEEAVLKQLGLEGWVD